MQPKSSISLLKTDKVGRLKMNQFSGTTSKTPMGMTLRTGLTWDEVVTGSDRVTVLAIYRFIKRQPGRYHSRY